LFEKIRPKDNSSKFERVWNASKAEFMGRNSALQKLWKKIERHLETLEQLEIFTIGDELDEMNELMESLAAEKSDGVQNIHNGSGSQNNNTGRGKQFINGGGENNRYNVNYGTGM
jgi:hypothetical protein